MYEVHKNKILTCYAWYPQITQHNEKATWANVPLQDFTAESDIDWSKSIDDIDKQLYKKYGLSDEEQTFIEGMIKKME